MPSDDRGNGRSAERRGKPGRDRSSTAHLEPTFAFPAVSLVITLVGTVILALLVLLAPLHRAVRFKPGEGLRYAGRPAAAGASGPLPRGPSRPRRRPALKTMTAWSPRCGTGSRPEGLMGAGGTSSDGWHRR